jgi:MraZ protein
MLIGKFIRKIEEKGRVCVPTKFRKKLGEKLVVVKDSSGCLSIYAEEEEGEIIKQRQWEIRMDKQGRIRLPDELKAHAGLKMEVVLLGLEEYIELWDPERLKGEMAKLKEEASTLLGSGII